MVAFYELISGPGRVNKRSGSSETACFIVRNGVTGFRGKSAMTRKSRNRPFRKMAIFEASCAFFWPPFLEALLFPLWSSVFWQHSRRGGDTRNATKQGVSERCRGFLHLRALWVCWHGKILWTRLEDNFLRGLLFCTVRCSNFCRNWVSRAKNPWGCRTELVLKRPFFAVCPLRAQIWRAGGARPCRFFSRIWGRCQKCPCGCGAEGFSVFSVFFLTPFLKTWSGPLHIPLFLFGCFSLLFAFFLGLGATPHCTCVFGQLAFDPSYFLGGFWGLLRKTLFFPLKKGYLGSFLSVSLLCLPFVLLGCFHFSLSLTFFFFFLFYFFFFAVFSLFLPSLFFLLFFLVLLLRFCFMRITTSKYYIWKFSFHNLFLFFLFCFSKICSYLCFFII